MRVQSYNQNSQVNFKMNLKQGNNLAKAVADGKVPQKLLEEFDQLSERLTHYTPLDKPVYLDYLHYPDIKQSQWILKPFKANDDFAQYIVASPATKEEDILKETLPITWLTLRGRMLSNRTETIWPKQ